MAEAIAFCATAYLNTHPPKSFKMDRTKRVFERAVEKSKAKWKVITGKARKEKKARALQENEALEAQCFESEMRVCAIEQEVATMKEALGEEKERGWQDRYRQCQLRIQAEEEREARIADSSIILNLIEEQETTATQYVSLEAELKIVKQEAATKSEEVKQFETRVIKAEQDLTSATEARDFHQGEASRLAIELSAARKKCSEVNTARLEATKKSEQTEKKFDTYKAANDNLTKEVKNLKAQLDELQEKAKSQNVPEPQKPHIQPQVSANGNTIECGSRADQLEKKIEKMQKDHQAEIDRMINQRKGLVNQKADLEADLGGLRADFRAWKRENAPRDPASPNSLTSKGNEYLEKLYEHLEKEHQAEVKELKEELRRAALVRDLLYAMLDAAREEKEPEPRRRSPSGAEDSSKGTHDDDSDDDSNGDDGNNSGDSASNGLQDSQEPKQGDADSSDGVANAEGQQEGGAESTTITQATSTYDLGRHLEALAGQQQLITPATTSQLNANAPEFHPQPRMSDEELWSLQTILSSVAAPQPSTTTPEETDTSFFGYGTPHSPAPQPAQPAVSPSTNVNEESTAPPQHSNSTVYPFTRPPYYPEDFRKLEHLEYEVLSREIRERNLRHANGMQIGVSNDYAAEQFHHQNGTCNQPLWMSAGPRSPPKDHKQMNIVGFPSRLHHEIDARDLEEEDAVAEHIHQTHAQVIAEKEDRWMPPQGNNWADEDDDDENCKDLVADAVHRFAASADASNGSKSPTPELSDDDDEEDSESDPDDDEINIDLGEAAETGYVPDEVAQAMNFRKWD